MAHFAHSYALFFTFLVFLRLPCTCRLKISWKQDMNLQKSPRWSLWHSCPFTPNIISKKNAPPPPIHINGWKSPLYSLGGGHAVLNMKKVSAAWDLSMSELELVGNLPIRRGCKWFSSRMNKKEWMKPQPVTRMGRFTERAACLYSACWVGWNRSDPTYLNFFSPLEVQHSPFQAHEEEERAFWQS